MSTQKSTELRSFFFNATVKLVMDDIQILQDRLPEVTSLSLSSRTFGSYDECISSCTGLMTDSMKLLNEKDGRFKLGSEVNPIHSGQQTLSRDWAPGEISRLWIYEKGMEKKGAITAIGQARIFGSTEPVAGITVN